MTINGGQPHRVGYIDQDYRVVVDEEREGEAPRMKRIGWTNLIPAQAFLDALNQHPAWSNARWERVEDKAEEARISAEQRAKIEGKRT